MRALLWIVPLATLTPLIDFISYTWQNKSGPSRSDLLTVTPIFGIVLAIGFVAHLWTKGKNRHRRVISPCLSDRSQIHQRT